MKELISGYSQLFIRIENMLVDQFQLEFGEIYADQNEKMNNFVKKMMAKIQEVKLFGIREKEKNVK